MEKNVGEWTGSVEISKEEKALAVSECCHTSTMMLKVWSRYGSVCRKKWTGSIINATSARAACESAA